jgi:hypothetical protein
MGRANLSMREHTNEVKIKRTLNIQASHISAITYSKNSSATICRKRRARNCHAPFLHTITLANRKQAESSPNQIHSHPPNKRHPHTDTDRQLHSTTLIPRVEKTKIIGVTYNTSLFFGQHITDIMNSYNKIINSLLAVSGSEVG